MAPVPILVEVAETGFALGSAAVGVERGGPLLEFQVLLLR